ncbi:MAG: alpha/beta hydrolase [Phenylobacterium sp.]|nr:MAG: alpha/beta hydrolase [Phenylobacterium sp.]
MADEGARAGIVRLPARDVDPPAGISDHAREALTQGRPESGPFPTDGDKDAWRAAIAATEAARAGLTGDLGQRLKADVMAHPLGGVPAYVATPRAERLVDSHFVLLDIHGGALIFGGGEAAVSLNAQIMALRAGRVAYSVDYRMPPDHPYPAALDDCLAAYRALLEIRPASEIILSGVSAGGNLAAALLLRARDEGLPTPAGALLMTPEVDLTESGDSFQTLVGLDFLKPLIEINRLYADGHDLAHPYLSPLFGEVSAFPPTFLQAGTRDIFLSNTVRLHRKLRTAGVRAELHVWEGMPHGGFGGFTPEDREMNVEMRAFIASL